MQSLAVILPAAGRSLRFGASQNKLLEKLDGVPVIRRSVDAFVQRKDVAAIVIATTPGEEPSTFDSVLRDSNGGMDPRLSFRPGGDSRAQSVLHALRHVSREIEWVAVHDAARPLVSQALIDLVLRAALDHGAAIPALAVSSTIRQARGPLPCAAERTLPRQSLFAVQTPQIMRRQALLDAFAGCLLPMEQITDDAQVMESAGHKVWLVTGEEQNMKITTQMDLHIAQSLINART